MEPQQLQNPADHQEVGKNGASFLCRQSSTRWTPTTDQIRILKDLYYNNGLRSPSAEQIQRISARLRQYGKIEGKNVFYWFQNHKARERQKKRFTCENFPIHRNAVWKSTSDDLVSPILINKFSNINSGYSFPSSSVPSPANFITMGSFGNDSFAVEKSFRDCSITPNPNITWIGVNSYMAQDGSFLEKRKCSMNETLEMEEEEQEEEGGEIETLPLFPMNGNVKQETEHHYLMMSGHNSAASNNIVATSAGAASLELTLNSCISSGAAARFSTAP